MSRVNYVAELERFLDPPQPEPPAPPPPPRPGRRKALGTGAVRDQGQFLQAIAKIILAGKGGDRSIPKQLQKLREYEDLSERQLQRNVAETLGLFDFLFSAYPKRERRKRVLDFIRHSWTRYLQRNN